MSRTTPLEELESILNRLVWYEFYTRHETYMPKYEQELKDIEKEIKELYDFDVIENALNRLNKQKEMVDNFKEKLKCKKCGAFPIVGQMNRLKENENLYLCWRKNSFQTFDMRDLSEDGSKEKQLKALGILKEIMPIEEEDCFYDEETDTYFFMGYKVSKEQFDLLKEVLL